MTIEIEIEVVCENCRSRLHAEYDYITKKIYVKVCKNCRGFENGK